MGGGGGYFGSDPTVLKSKLQASDEGIANEEHRVAVADFLSELLARFNNRDTQAIRDRLEEVKGAIEEDLDGTVDLLFGGSIAKQTYIEGFSDVDSLVMLDNCELAGQPPRVAKDWFEGKLRHRFPGSPITAGKLAVTISFGDVEIQLLPAMKCESNMTISDAAGKSWSEIDPKRFATQLTRANQVLGQKLVPTIKLVKGIVAGLPEAQRVSGYHAEALAMKAFRGYGGHLSLGSMVRHFFNEAMSLVRRPIRDSTGQSYHVDDQLGRANSLERRVIADAFGRIARRLRNADTSGSVDEWRTLFDY